MKIACKVGFATCEETEEHSGIWVNTVKDKTYYGDFVKASYRPQINPDSINDNLVLSHQVTIIADPYATEHYQDICYVEVEGAKWKVTYVEIQYPRLRLTLGGVYNGPEPAAQQT